jgi:YVTN family beta-propeller protein
MLFHRITLSAIATAALVATVSAQHAQTSAVAVNPNNTSEVWVCNRDNQSVSVIDTVAGVATAQIDVGVKPRTLAFSADGQRVFVANQRGNVAETMSFISPFDGTEIRGTVSVIDVASRTVTTTMNLVGCEPYGLAVAPNGKYFAVTGFRSGTVKLFNTSTLALVTEYQYLRDLNFIQAPYTIKDVDANRDGIADLGEPRGFVIRADSARIYVTHDRSPFISVLDVALDANGAPTGVTLASKIDINTYPFDPHFNPTKVQTIASQGLPRFAEDIALSPDGTRALVPHLLHNVNHDVNFSFPAWLPGAFANRVYPALSVIDTASNTFNVAGDRSKRLHNELTDSVVPGEFAAYGQPAHTATGYVTLGGFGTPLVGNAVVFRVGGLAPGESAAIYIGTEANVPMGALGTRLVNPRYVFPVPANGVLAIPVANRQVLIGQVQQAQALVFTSGGQPAHYSNGLKFRLSNGGTGQNKLGHRAGHPSRVAYNEAGTRALMLNRGSEDVFLYEVAGSNLRLTAVYPPRIQFQERAALDTTTPMGDLPLGMVVVPDDASSNDDALVYVINELTRTLSVLRVDWAANTIVKEHDQIPTLLNPDVYTLSQRVGDELFEDASRGQTTGAHGTVGEFNNSCASCHFEGGEDGNVWQRANGPRSTMPVYGGTLMTGLILWKGVRLNMGETGPMFHGENGGTGVLTDTEQRGLIDMHENVPVPLNPNLDPVTGQYSSLAALGKDLYFGSNITGLNPQLRRAGCAECHPDHDPVLFAQRGYTADYLEVELSLGADVENFDPSCISLQANITMVNVRNVNSGANVDFNNDGVPDPDRNFDGYPDVETYNVMNSDKHDPFTRDDTNSYMCPLIPGDPNSALKVFQRDMRNFSIPTKLGAWSTGPYFHDHSALTLRAVVDPETQALSPIYGQPAYGGPATNPGLNKFFNEFHDVRGHEQFVPGASKVQLNLISGANVNNDIEALLAYITSL